MSWQIVPARLDEWFADPAIAEKIMPVFLKMKKVEIEPLRAAVEA